METVKLARDAVAEAEAAGIAPATTNIDNLIRELLRRQRQVAVIWCMRGCAECRRPT